MRGGSVGGMIAWMVPVLVLAFVAVLLLIVIRRRNLGVLMQVASLLGAVLALIWLQDNGYLDTSAHRPAIDVRPAPEGGR